MVKIIVFLPVLCLFTLLILFAQGVEQTGFKEVDSIFNQEGRGLDSPQKIAVGLKAAVSHVS